MLDLTKYPQLLACLSLFDLGKRYLRRRGRAVRGADRERSAFYQRIWSNAADAIGAAIEPLGDGIFEISRGDARTRVYRNLTPLDDPITLAVAGNKPLTYRLLSADGLPTPPHTEFTLRSLGRAVEFFESGRVTCVVKPARDTGAGHGVTTGITDRRSLARAATLAASYGESLLIEQQVRGENFRLLYLDGTLLDAVVRRSPTVIGDGQSTVRTLVRQANESRLARGAAGAQFLLTFDLDMNRTLAAQKLSLRSVPEAGRRVTLKTVVNENGGSDNLTATHVLCDSVVADGARAAAAIGSRLAGVDIISPDPTVPLAEAGGVISEVNTTPGLYYHYHKADGPTPVAVPILERLLDGRPIPSAEPLELAAT